MAKRLTEQERKDRDAAREAAAAESTKKHWREKMEATRLRMAEAGAKWDEALAAKKLTLRDLWLVLAVFETEERIHLAGARESCKTKWFDRIAPRARKAEFSLSYGLTGYTTRTANKASLFLNHSSNGYIYITDLGCALVQQLRERHPELAAGRVENAWKEVEVKDLGTIPAPRWKDWKDWDEKSAA
jgi:hypothetical protein